VTILGGPSKVVIDYWVSQSTGARITYKGMNTIKSSKIFE